MNILIVTGIFPPDIGGPATYVPHVAAGLADRGHQVTVLTLTDGASSPADQFPFRVSRLPRQRFKPWRWLHTILEIIRLGRDAGVIFVNGLAMEAALANLLLRKPMVQKVVADLAWEQAARRIWVQDDFEIFQKKRYGLKVEILKALRAWWTRKADRVIVPSRYLADWVKRWGVPEAKIIVIYNAVEPFNGVAPFEAPLQTPTKVVTVGRLIPLKRVDQMIEAIARFEGVGLVIIGDGPERSRLEALGSAFGIGDRIYFSGARSREETIGLMATCDLFVLNSTHEGFPYAVLEAMRLGVPVIATAVGGMPEVVSDHENGRLIAPRDNGALYEALSELIESPSERQRLADGARRTSDRFGFQRMVDESARLLERTAIERS